MTAANTSLVRHERTPVELDATVVPADFPLSTIVIDAESQLRAMLPPGQTIERVLVELYNVTRKTPQLLQAKAEQLVPALCDALSLGGVIGRDVYLAPFNNSKANRVDVTVMVDYKFEAELVCLAGGAKSIQAFNWYANEEKQGLFDYGLGSGAFVKHRRLSPSTRGAWVGSYAVADIGPGALPIVFIMFAEEIEALRMRSKQWSDKALTQKGEKAGCPEWYGPKSCVHRVVKLLPKKPSLRAQLDRIAAAERMEFEPDPDEVARIEAPDRQTGIGGAPADERSHSADRSEHGGQAHGSFDLDGVDVEGEDESPTMTLEQAENEVVQGKKLKDYRNIALSRIETHAKERIDEEGEGSKYVRLLVAVKVLLAAREKGEAVEPAKVA